MNTAKQECDDLKYLNFSLGQEKFVVPLLSVRGVTEASAITLLPAFPPYVLGLMEFSDHLTSVVDLRLKMNKGENEERPAKGAVIVLDLGDSLRTGILVDSVNGVISVSDSAISACAEETEASLLMGVVRSEEQTYHLLDVRKVL
jgi:purine-binding chemotaxis protein CheW